jgi:hypothetical protein
VMRNMCLRDAVHKVGPDGSEHVAVNRAERAALEVPLSRSVVREHGIRVLKVSDLQV